MHLASGCQDGLLRIYDTCHPEKVPDEFRIASGIADGITKINFMTSDPNLIIIGKKSGVLEKWDTRSSTKEAVSVASIPGGETVMDFEVSAAHNLLLVASGTKVCERNKVNVVDGFLIRYVLLARRIYS